MNRWTLLRTSAPDTKGNVVMTARDGARVANVTCLPLADVTDDMFDADFAHALDLHRAKRGTNQKGTLHVV